MLISASLVLLMTPGLALFYGGMTGLAWINTTVATAAAMLGWMLCETIRDRAANSLGIASGAVAGLVTITPAAGTLTPLTSIVVGFIGGVITCMAIVLRRTPRWIASSTRSSVLPAPERSATERYGSPR